MSDKKQIDKHVKKGTAFSIDYIGVTNESKNTNVIQII
jgi:hypothetical protein